jgi:hypothetical protein
MKATTRKATMKKIVAGLCLAVLAAGPAMALDMTPFQIGFGGANAQLFPPETMVMGLRLNLVASENQDMMGLDGHLVQSWSWMRCRSTCQTGETDFDGINVGCSTRWARCPASRRGCSTMCAMTHGVRRGVHPRDE